MEIHEEPRFSRLDPPLRSGYGGHRQPGIYLTGRFGVRIEDMVLVTEEGCRSLTQVAEKSSSCCKKKTESLFRRETAILLEILQKIS